jgi:hypothetical protein
MMTNPTLIPQTTAQMQDCIGDLLVQLNAEYQQTKLERRELTTIVLPTEDFGLLEELELVTVDLRGYGSQIEVTGGVLDAAVAIGHLQRLRVLDRPVLRQFFFETEGYPLLKDYLRRLDYLRLLVLEYLQAVPERQSAA